LGLNLNGFFDMLKKMFTGIFINSSRYYLDCFAKEAADSLPNGALVLDAGAGNCPYKYHFSHVRYESADFCQVDKEYGEITYVCDLTTIPVEDNRFDLILCSQALEHVPEPGKVLEELFRILKPGGSLWLTCPLFYEEHETPYDFYRYTQYGLKHLIERAGFLIIRIEWLEGYLGTLAYQLSLAAKALPIQPFQYGGGIFGVVSSVFALFLKPLFAILAVLFSRLDLRKKFISGGLCKNYAVVAIASQPKAVANE
jgi:SAM-dependent methyltransferase